MEWQVFTPGELEALARALVLRPLVLCADFDEQRPATPTLPRMQLVCERGEPAEDDLSRMAAMWYSRGW